MVNSKHVEAIRAAVAHMKETPTLSEHEARERLQGIADDELALELSTRLLPGLLPSWERLMLEEAIRRLVEGP